MIISLGQYVTRGEVSWLTDTFAWVERTGRAIVDDPRGALQNAGNKLVSQSSELTDEFLDQTALGSNPSISWSAPAFDLSGRVVRIADGDTLTILDADNQQHKIRLHGIDSPETDQPFGKSAKRELSDLVSGEGVGIDIQNTDRYGRTVGVVYLGARSINLEMVRSGYAWWYKKYAPFSDALREAERYARTEGRGLWADPNPVAPWDWRRGLR